MAVTGNEPVSTGNLKSVIESMMGGGAGSIADLIYPVGSIFLSTSDTSPQAMFGGTWRRIQDRFLLCAGAQHSAGETGGEERHVLTESEMPSHSHTVSAYRNGSNWNERGNRISAGNPEYSSSVSASTSSAGGGSAHNNMPPYLAVYAWERVA